MRTLSADMQARINKVQQTTHQNANPLMQSVVTKAIQTVQIKTLREADRLGSIDLAFEFALGAITKAWIIGVVDGVATITTYNFPDPDWETPDSTFSLAPVTAGGVVRDVSVTLDGTNPWLFWVERTSSHDKIYALQWDGADPAVQPVATELLSVAR